VEKTEQKLAKGNNWGILGMRERLELLEGSMNISSVPGEGTRITMEIPIQSQNGEEKTDG
jgi:two-component system, NarL family, sensor histidine kinase DegS